MNPTQETHLESIDPRLAEANRVLIGDNGVSADPVGAASLYKEALEAGVGAAGVRLAVLAAVGVARPANWSEALDRLEEAAELGHHPAERQLAVLAGRDDLALRTGSAALWRNVRKDIDVAALLKAPTLRRVSVAPAIALIDGLATKAMCRWLIAKAKPRLERGMVRDLATGQPVPDPIRTGLSAGFGLADTDLVLVATQERLARASGLVVHQQEAPHVLTYEPGQEYRPHFDFMNPTQPAFAEQLAIMGQRVATCLTWLNEDYEGGETDFPRASFRYKGKTGDAMLFLNVTQPDRRPDPLTLHAGLSPTRGRKWLLSQWVRDRVQAIV